MVLPGLGAAGGTGSHVRENDFCAQHPLLFVGRCPGSHRTSSWGQVHCLFVGT